MKTILAAAATAAILGGALMMPNTADAKGCLKGAAVGGVAGHMVGNGHATAGAATGCAVGHHEANKKLTRSSRSRIISSPPIHRTAIRRSSEWWQ